MISARRSRMPAIALLLSYAQSLPTCSSQNHTDLLTRESVRFRGGMQPPSAAVAGNRDTNRGSIPPNPRLGPLFEPATRTTGTIRRRALDSGGSCGGIQHLPPRDPPESNAPIEVPHSTLQCKFLSFGAKSVHPSVNLPRARRRNPKGRA